MQTDMHFYGTYAMARAAGIPREDSHTIAYAAQFVDDSTKQDSELHSDGGLLYGIATAHHPLGAAFNAAINPEEQRRVWVPFHFIPGGAGDSLSEKLLCVKDSAIAKSMIEHHIERAKNKVPFGFELLGIAAHVYMDTFSHYGFSGISSDHNEVDWSSIQEINMFDPKVEKYIKDKKEGFFDKYIPPSVQGLLAEKASRGLGHAGVATYPDRPFLHWQVTFDLPRPSNGTVSDRDNPETFLEGCEKLHTYLSGFAEHYYTDSHCVPFADIKEDVSSILRFEGDKASRIERWRSAIRDNARFQASDNEAQVNYDAQEWEREKSLFSKLATSADGIETHIYRFHQAAALHRYYVLKELLPANGIAVC